MKLNDKVAIITGGANGIGRGITHTFLKYGAKVIVLDYADNLESVIKGYQDQNLPIEGYQVDVRNKTQINTIIENVNDKYGQIDCLVNNAGVFHLDSFLNTDDEKRDYQFDINIKGVWNVTQAVVPYMDKGSIVNLSSVTGPLVADPGEVAYATTKSAVQGFTKGLAAELVEKGIRVNAIQPGYIMTPLVEKMARESNPDDPQKAIDDLASSIPMKRLGDPKETGELAAFLCSDESSYITGQSIVIDGGSTMPETTVMGV